MLFNVTFVPVTMSPVIREMNRQTRQIEAASLKDATQAAVEAFESQADWMLEKVDPS